MLLSYGFSHLPFGSLAYRVNFMSAVWGAVTVGLLFLCARRVGCNRLASIVAALGLGHGVTFWSVAVVAEVYTLTTVLLAATLLALLRWGQTRSHGAYYVAVMLMGLNLGHHTTTFLFVPAFAAYVLSIDTPWVFHTRRLAATLGLTALGFLPYAFIAIRTWQGAPYVETPITNLSDFGAAVLAQRWHDDLFVFDIPSLLNERLPLVTTLLAREFSLPGVLIAIVGLGYLLRFRVSQALLFGIGGLLNLLFIVNYEVPGFDFGAFLFPTVLVGWLCVAIALERMWVLLRFFRWPAHALFVSVVMVGSGWHLQQGYAASDRSSEFDEIRRFDALFAQLPTHSVIVTESYLVDSMLRYKLLGESAAGDRDIHGPVPFQSAGLRQLHEEGFSVFAFPGSAVGLRLRGFRFSELFLFEPVQRHLAFGAKGTLVAVAAPRGVTPPLAGSGVGSTVGNVGESFRPTWGLIGVIGTNRKALERWHSEGIQLAVKAGGEIGATGIRAPIDLRVSADVEKATIWRGARPVVTAAGSAVVAELDPDGTLRETHVLRSDTGFDVEFDQTGLQLYRVLDPGLCQDVTATGWTDVSEFARAGKAAVRIPNGSSLEIYMGRDTALGPRLSYVDDESGLAPEARSFTQSHDSQADLRHALDRDGVPNSTIVAESLQIYRLTLEDTVTQAEVAEAMLVLGGIPQFDFRQACSR